MPDQLLSAPCGGCGLVCDDTLFDPVTRRLARTCALGDAWFAERIGGDAHPGAAAHGGAHGDPRSAVPAARVHGNAASVEQACAEAAAALSGARAPLLYGFGRTSIETVRVAVGLADRLGATIDPAGPSLDGSGGVAVALRGASTATLGELRDRPGALVIWREDPLATHPRLLERLRLDGARRDDLIVVGDPASATAAVAGTVIDLPPERDLDALRLLRTLVRGGGVTSFAADAPDVLAADATTALPLAPLRALAQRLRAQPHVTFLHGGGLGRGRGGARRALALHELVRELDRNGRHAVTLLLRREANAAGAEDVLAWQTGFPTAVDLGAGHPRSLPGTGSARELLAARAVDVVLCVASDLAAHLGADADALLDGATVIALDAIQTATTRRAQIAVATAALGVAAAGTVHRLDGVPIPLRAPLAGARPSEAELLHTIAALIGRRRDETEEVR